MKYSLLLREAKRHLWDGRSASCHYEDGKDIYVCIAISRASHRLGLDWFGRDATLLGKWIFDLLGRRPTLESWLRAKGVPLPSFITGEDRIRVQAHRLQWLDWMIAYWEGRGE
ncbi:MAG: hypothetical protein ACE15D_18905 [Candidatus Eisenbacteria bacterium]